MPFNLGPVELGLILLIVAMLFGVGKLPEVFGLIGKGVREFRKESALMKTRTIRVCRFSLPGRL